MIAQPAFPFSRKKSLSPLSAGYTERVAQTWTIGRFGRSFPPTETILQGLVSNNKAITFNARLHHRNYDIRYGLEQQIWIKKSNLCEKVHSDMTKIMFYSLDFFGPFR